MRDGDLGNFGIGRSRRIKRSHKVIVALTVQEILDEHIAKKLV